MYFHHSDGAVLYNWRVSRGFSLPGNLDASHKTILNFVSKLPRHVNFLIFRTCFDWDLLISVACVSNGCTKYYTAHDIDSKMAAKADHVWEFASRGVTVESLCVGGKTGREGRGCVTVANLSDSFTAAFLWPAKRTTGEVTRPGTRLWDELQGGVDQTVEILSSHLTHKNIDQSMQISKLCGEPCLDM